MKKYIFGSLLLAAGMLTACSLDENPESSFSEEEAMKSETLVYLNTVAAVYNELGNLQNTTLADASNFVSDEFFVPGRLGDWVDGGVPQNKFTHNILPSHGGQAGWSNLFATIAKANSAIAKLGEINSSAANDYIFELRAYRAFLYYHLVDLYGNVPVVTSPEQSTAETAPTARPEVFKFVVKELTECLPHLSTAMAQKSGTYFGRMTQPVAYMVLAKLALNASWMQLDPTQANWSKDYMGADMTGKNTVSEDKATQITELMKAQSLTIDGQTMNSLDATIYCVNKLEDLGYSLSPSYQENFAVTNENSVENIWTIPNDAVTYKRGWDHQRRSWHYNHAGHPAYKGFSSWNGPCATTWLAKQYGYTEDRQDLSTCDPRFEMNFYIDRDYVNETGARVTDGFNNGVDVSKSELALEYMPLWSVVDMSNSEAAIKAKQAAAKYYGEATPDEFFQHVVKSAGARFRKYAFDFGTSNASYPGNDLVVFRFADAKMMRAEAEYRKGDKGTALSEINDVRARVGLEPLTDINMQVISEERQKELAWEGTRRQDMIRYAILNQPTPDRYVGVPVNGSASAYSLPDGHTYVWPIPADQMALNTNLKQAWGY
ncbi:MAG: RagB/SusD family nutrient uptake outer membrane protein [Bacteroidaceae bacterium]|nr:RagB/SusD family nutrient uptake outer membrane protein [Bacteroidaceae bacterium]